MPTLDLHGEKYETVQHKVHSFVYNNDLPVRIITGKSSPMKKIVIDTISLLGYYTHHEHLTNEGCLVVTEGAL
jgi:hypothetical protein